MNRLFNKHIHRLQAASIRTNRLADKTRLIYQEPVGTSFLNSYVYFSCFGSNFIDVYTYYDFFVRLYIWVSHHVYVFVCTLCVSVQMYMCICQQQTRTSEHSEQ